MSGLKYGAQIPIVVSSRKDISSTAKLVYGLVLAHMGKHSEAWPSIRLLAREAGVSKTSIETALRCLGKAGLLVAVSRGGRGPGASNHYTVVVPKTGTITPERDVPVSERDVPISGTIDVPNSGTEVVSKELKKVLYEGEVIETDEKPKPFSEFHSSQKMKPEARQGEAKRLVDILSGTRFSHANSDRAKAFHGDGL